MAAVSAAVLSPAFCRGQAIDHLAQGALTTILGDLTQEIANGSTVQNPAPPIYLPNSTAYLAPVRNTPTNPTSTLIRISSTNPIVFPGADHGASAVNSATAPALNGLTVTPSAWNSHYLLPLLNPTTPSDTTPVASFSAPEWVYETAAGPVTLTAPNPSVIGRYAYAVYDEAALLDANVAGFPRDTSTFEMPSQYAPKGALAFADLTQLPGPITQAGVNNLVGWRNYASLKNATSQPSGSFPNLSFTGPSVLAPYLNLIRSNTNGFLAPSSATYNGQTDQIFSRRQDLINFVVAVGRTNFNPQALQYLTHFSRAINAPSWHPRTPAGSTIDYAANAEQPSSINRDLVNVRFSSSGTITHYSDDGTTMTYTVQAGVPLLQRRFSLAKLAWIGPQGPAAGITAQAISDCFGLQWNASKWRWDYVAAKAPPGVAIKTLDQVASENREPNFFELLNAGILHGSLGGNPGKGMDDSVTSGVGVYSSRFDEIKTEPNLHILQIGANIIDQFDSDSYPTAIHFDAWGFTGADDLSLQTIYGVENLPYLLGLFPIAIADPVPPGGGISGVLKSWVQPQLWNPHQVPTSALTNYPFGFRAYAYGNISIAWSDGAAWNPRFSPWTSYDDGTGNVGTPGNLGVIYFTNSADSTSPFYSTPRPLTLDLTTSIGSPIVDKSLTPATNYYDATKWSSLGGDISPPNQFAGFALVGDPNYNPNPNTGNVSRKMLLPDIARRASYSLQYKGPDGNYHPYNFMARVTQDQDQTRKRFKPSRETNASGVIPTTTVMGETAARGFGPARLDPRTDRFSESTQSWSGKTLSTMNPAPNFYNPPFGSGVGGNGDFGIPYSSNFTYVPAYNPVAPTSPPTGGEIELFARNDRAYSVTISATLRNAYYADLDSVVRYADGYRGNTTTGDGCELYHGNAAVSPTSTLTTPGTGSAQARRPAILNRPFRSVGELGFAYRDLPFKSLDFWSTTSGDAALLDLFSVTDQPTVVAGQINVSNASTPVLQAVLSGVSKSDALGVQINSSDLATLVNTIAADTAANGPYSNRADLATQLGPLVSGSAGTVAFNTTLAANSNWANKAYAEAPMRALADVTNTRTWNLMIDVIAQTGMFAPNASNLNALNVQGQRRYWLHVAIDRYTGKMVDQSLEEVPTPPTIDVCEVAENVAPGATVGTLSASGSSVESTFTYTLVSGAGNGDNGSFTISGNRLQTAAVFHYLTQNSYSIRVRATDQNGSSMEQILTIRVLPDPYTQWKITNFQENAADPAVAGDNISPAGDGLPNLLKYALGLSPFVPSRNGVALTQSSNQLTLSYTRSDAATDITMHAYWSNDLTNWSNGGVTETMLSDDNTIQLWQATVPIDPKNPRMFMRAEVTRP